MFDMFPLQQSTSALDTSLAFNSSTTLFSSTPTAAGFSDPLASSALNSASLLSSSSSAIASSILVGNANLGVLEGRQIQTGIISGYDNFNTYRFNLTTPTNLTLSLTGVGGDADLFLYRDLGNGQFSLVDSRETNGNNEVMSLSGLASGTYYADVYQFGDVYQSNPFSTSYTLTLTTDTAGNTLSTARNLGVLTNSSTTNSTTVRDFVGSGDSEDFYRLQLTGNRNDISISLKDLTANADLYLIRDANNNGLIDSGDTIASSRNVGTASESINFQGLAAGNYFVEVAQSSGDANYTLAISTVSSNSFALPSVTNTINVGNLQGRATYNQSVNSLNNPDDFYRFDLTTTTKLDLSLTGTGGDADLYLAQDVNGDGRIDLNEIIRYVAIDDNQESISLASLAAGTYYAIVDEFGMGTTNYTLTMTTDSAGNSLNGARNLGSLSSGTTTTIRDFVGTEDALDFYRFQLNGVQNSLDISLKDLTADADLYLIRDVNNNGVIDVGDTIASSLNFGTTADSISLQGLSAGNYFVEVAQYSGTTNYTLGLSTTAFNTPAPVSFLPIPTTTTIVGNLQGRTSYSQSINSSTNPDDFYRFDLTTTSNLNLLLTGVGGDADLYLARDVNGDGRLDSSEFIRYSVSTGNQESISMAGLTAGTYYAIVDEYGIGTTNYTLTLTADTAGGNMKDARNLGVVSTGITTTVKDFVGAIDPQDFYRFQITGTSTDLLVNLKDLTADADVYVIQDKNNNGIVDFGETIGFSYNSGTTPDTIYLQNLAAGNYFIDVVSSGNSSNTNFTLGISALSSGAGNSFGAPIDLGTVSVERSMSGSFTTTDWMDFYHFNLGSTSDLNLNLTELSTTADLYLFRDANNNGVFDSGDLMQRSLVASPTSSSLDLTGLAAGSYFVGVFREGGNTNYTLNLTPDMAGNTLSTARNMGTLTGDRAVANYLSQSQPTDYYRFTLSSTSTVELDLAGLGVFPNGQSVGVGLALIRDVNGNGIVESTDILRQSSNNGAASTTITTTLTAGTYYVRVMQQDSASTNYKLNLVATPA